MVDIDVVAQVGIAVFGVTSIILVSKKNKWGFVFGLMSQPFFLITSFINEQWGLLFLSVIYTFSWVYGIYEWFFRDSEAKKGEMKNRKN